MSVEKWMDVVHVRGGTSLISSSQSVQFRFVLILFFINTNLVMVVKVTNLDKEVVKVNGAEFAVVQGSTSLWSKFKFTFPFYVCTVTKLFIVFDGFESLFSNVCSYFLYHWLFNVWVCLLCIKFKNISEKRFFFKVCSNLIILYVFWLFLIFSIHVCKDVVNGNEFLKL